MKIVRIDVFGYELSYRYGRDVMSGDQVVDSLPSTVVRLATDEGLEGWGEICPLGPLYLASHGEGARAARSWDSRPKASVSARLIPYLSAIRSAPSNWLANS